MSFENVVLVTREDTWNKDHTGVSTSSGPLKGCGKVSDPMLLLILQYLVPFSWCGLQLTADEDRIGVYDP